MPFQSEKQRKFLFARKPEVARKLAQHAKIGDSHLHGPLTGFKRPRFVVPKAKMEGAGLGGATAVSGGSPGMGEGQNVAHAAMTGVGPGGYLTEEYLRRLGKQQPRDADTRPTFVLPGAKAKMIPEHGGRDEVAPTALEPGGHVSATRPAGTEPVSPKMAGKQLVTPTEEAEQERESGRSEYGLMAGDFAGGMAFEREHGQAQDSDKARARRVREHLQERPQYYVELKRYLNPDIGGMAGKLKETRTMDEMSELLIGEDDEDGNSYDHHPDGAFARVDDFWREDPAQYNGKVLTVPINLVTPHAAVFQADIRPDRVLHCGNCGAYSGNARTGKCSRLVQITGKAGLPVHFFNTCTIHRPIRAGTPVEGGPKGPLDSARPRPVLILVRKALGNGPVPTVAPIAGSAPRDRTPALPDYQEIYYQPKDDARRKLEAQQQAVRRAGNRERNRATYGFHGSPGTNLSLEPVLRYESDIVHDDSKRAIYGEEALIGQRGPQVEAPEFADRMDAGSPYDEDGSPPGATDEGRVPRSPDERDDETVPDVNGRPIPLDPETNEEEDEEEDEADESMLDEGTELDEPAGPPFDEDEEDDSLLADAQGRVEPSEDRR